LSGLTPFEQKVITRYREQQWKEKRMDSPLMVDYLGFIERFRAGPRQQRIRIRPETLSRCEQSVGTAAYARWYLGQLAERLNT
jgi:hypothetical protein